MPAGDGAGAGDRGECGHPGQPCVIYQAVGREAVPDPGRRDERPDPAGALRVVPSDLAGGRRRPACPRRPTISRPRSPAPSPGTSSARSARAATSWPRTAPCPSLTAATCSPSSRPAPTAWSWPPTTTPAPARGGARARQDGPARAAAGDVRGPGGGGADGVRGEGRRNERQKKTDDKTRDKEKTDERRGREDGLPVLRGNPVWDTAIDLAVRTFAMTAREG